MPILLLTACRKDTPAGETGFHVGERVPVGSLVYTVTEVEWRNQLGSDLQSRVPNNRFAIIRISVTNGGGKTVALPMLFLEPEKGERIPEVQDVEGLPEWLGLLREIEPADTLQGRIVFDAPPRDIKLRLTDAAIEDDEKTAYVQIRYSLGGGSGPGASSGL